MSRVEPLLPPLLALTLHDNEHHDSTLYRFEIGTRLQFRPGPSLFGRKVLLYTNYVIEDESDSSPREFVRTQYYQLPWQQRTVDSTSSCTPLGADPIHDGDIFAEITLQNPGPFHYYFQYEQGSSSGPRGSGYLQVSPRLSIPLDALCVQTVLAKSCGPLSQWRPVLRPAKEAQYNMIHFTPVQALGASNSSYSIKDHLSLDPRLGDVTFDDLDKVLQNMRDEWGMLSICDVVLNHLANETPWLIQHPEATYNCLSCAYLRPAALLDVELARISTEVASGSLESCGVPAALTKPEHVAALRPILEKRLFALDLHQCFQCDVDQLCQQFANLAKGRLPSPAPKDSYQELVLKLDPGRRRLAATVDLDLALRLLHVTSSDNPAGDLKRALRDFKARLEALNEAAEREMADNIHAAINNVLAGVSYERLASDGPKLPVVSGSAPLSPPYFTGHSPLECDIFGSAGAAVMAHNGWLMSADPLQDFAAKEQGGRVYLRRELIAWGDSVKLRYGSRPEDSPFLWDYMKQYVQLTARLFDGIRLDNCHSTPLHVAEYLLDAARSERPHLYVVAELFTNSDHVDNIYVNRLGITALIREGLSAGDCREQGRLVYRYGGPPVGSLRGPGGAGEVPEAPACVAPALLIDMTHDNQSPVQTRTAHDVLPLAAVVSFAGCAVGSTRGLDELLPHNVHVVTEDRLYAPWSDQTKPGEVTVNANTGIMCARKLLNQLHQDLAVNGFTEIFVDQKDEDVVAITRQNPTTRESVVLVARTVFREDRMAGERHVELKVEGEVRGELSAVMTGRGELPTETGDRLAGLRGLRCVANKGEVPQGWLQKQGGTLRITLPAAAVLVLRVTLPASAQTALRRLDGDLRAVDQGSDQWGLQAALEHMCLADFNTLLYRCEAEERAANGEGVYTVPGYGPLLYAGLMGPCVLLERIAAADDLGHPLCDNLRAGDWLGEYSVARLQTSGLNAAAAALKAALQPLKDLPRALQPVTVWRVWKTLTGTALQAALSRMSPNVRVGATRRTLSLCSVSLTAPCKDAPLPHLPTAPSLSAGLPHFASGYMRVWGRDTFISLRGLYILTGRHEDAKAHILGFAACLRHGLIPNLLDSGKNARFNCRDAVWWWLYSIQQYCKEVPDGESILLAPVRRIFPTDDSLALEDGPIQPLCDVMQEAIQAHFSGRHFRERNAGRGLDAHMTEQGFTVQIGVQPDTGFVFGGNEANCGTWMDKMGSSDHAGNRGKPATPRDGSAVEIVALCYSTVAWLAELGGKYPHPGVRRPVTGGTVYWSWAAWAERLRNNFERHYWVPEQPSAADQRPDLVHRRAIYKDTCGASQPWADYQLRPNMCVAMCVAPDLFTPKHAWLALGVVREHLLTPLGLRTLDPADWNYRPDYRNSDDGTDPSTAHGFNYHQGPPWTWPLPFYCRAVLSFGVAVGKRSEASLEAWQVAGRLAAEVLTAPWRGLPELTDSSGAPCPDSCRSQAWSAAAAIELLMALRPSQA